MKRRFVWLNHVDSNGGPMARHRPSFTPTARLRTSRRRPSPTSPPPSGDPIAGTLTYSGATLSLSTVTGNTFSTQWSNINIPIDVGPNTAYVWFTGSLYTAPSTQDATAWTFAN
jgi:hypothetical protein